MKKTILAVLTASMTLAMVAAEETPVEVNGAAATEGAVASVAQKPKNKLFTTLPCCAVAEGEAAVLRPGDAEWSPAERGRHYPLGSRYRTRGAGELTLAFGPEATATISGDAEFATRAQGLDVSSRTVELVRGTLLLDLPTIAPQGAMIVAAPSFKVTNPAGKSKYVYTDKGDGDLVAVRCVTGTMSLEGMHFTIPELRAADELHVRTTRDQLETFLYGISGNYIVRLDGGVETKKDINDDGSAKFVAAPRTLDWHLSPETKVRIDRMKPGIGERMAVSVMTFDTAGELKNNFAFTEGRAEVNTGELVKQVVAKKDEGDAKAEEAASATETTVAVTEDEAASTDTNNKKSEEKSEE